MQFCLPGLGEGDTYLGGDLPWLKGRGGGLLHAEPDVQVSSPKAFASIDRIRTKLFSQTFLSSLNTKSVWLQPINLLVGRAHLHPATATHSGLYSYTWQKRQHQCLHQIYLSHGNGFATHFGAISQRRRKCRRVAGCKWAHSSIHCTAIVTGYFTHIFTQTAHAWFKTYL